MERPVEDGLRRHEARPDRQHHDGDPWDHTITLGWSKPRSSTPIEYYLISYLGETVTAPGGSNRQFTIGGLDNNQKYIFTIRAKNSIDLSPERQSAPFQSIGTPAPPTGLNVVDRQSGQQATNVNATWTATLPEGPAPTLYSLFYSRSGAQPVVVPGCNRIQADHVHARQRGL